jgi:Mrp family chromosome partitioning ATPase
VQIGRWNHTSKGEIRSALQTLSDADVTPIGVIATRFDLTQAKRYGDNTVYIQRAIPAHR